MAEIRLWAVSIQDVRGIFTAEPDVRERLLAEVPTVDQPSDHRHSRRGKLGPLLRRSPQAPVVPAGQPTRQDAEVLLHGHYVPPERLSVTWLLFERWLNLFAASTLVIPGDQSVWDRLDFDLARAGLSSRYGVRHFWARDASLPLRPQLGTTVGYQRNADVLELQEAWTQVFPEVDPGSRELAGMILGWLDGFAQWTPDAEQAGRPAPDLFAVGVD